MILKFYEVDWNRILSVDNGLPIVSDTELYHMGKEKCVRSLFYVSNIIIIM